MASEVTSQSEAKRRGEGPRAVRAWTAAWEVLNTPAGVVVSVIAALGGMMAVFLERRLLAQINRGTGGICEAHGYGTPKCVLALETMFDACTL